jgi:hypothetical protein
MTLKLLTLDIETRIVAKTKANGACLEWQNATQKGYGAIHVAGKVRRVHRLACELIHGAPHRSGLTHFTGATTSFA